MRGMSAPLCLSALRTTSAAKSRLLIRSSRVLVGTARTGARLITYPKTRMVASRARLLASEKGLIALIFS